MKKRNLTLKFFILLGIGLLITSNYYLFKKDSNVARSYYLYDQQEAYTSIYEHFLPKHSIIAANETIYVTEKATSLDEIRVKEGQPIFEGDTLANYYDSNFDVQLRTWNNELNAYKQQLEQLKRVLDEIEDMGDRNKPSSAINSSSFNDQLSVNIKAEILQEQSIAGAIAVLQHHIAETDRNITVISTKITQSSINKALTSPINGSIGKITTDSGYITFEIHSEEKTITVYVSEEEWEIIEPGQSVLLSLDEEATPITGVIEGKQLLPAYESLWYEEMVKQEYIDSDELLYEVQFTMDDLLLTEPFATVNDAHITITTHTSSSVTNVDRIEYKSQKEKTEPAIYSLGYDGKIRKNNILIFDELSLKQIKSDENIGVVNLPKKEPNPQLRFVKERGEKEAVIFEAISNEKTILLPKQLNDIYAPTFLPIPLEKFSFKNIGTIRWQDVTKYLIK